VEIPVDNLSNTLRLLDVYPNPSSDQVQVAFEVGATQDLPLQLYDTEGRLVFSQTKNCPAGGNVWQIQGTKLPSAGLYVFRLSGVSGQVSGKWMYQP
jgi:hypothetical protein